MLLAEGVRLAVSTWLPLYYEQVSAAPLDLLFHGYSRAESVSAAQGLSRHLEQGQSCCYWVRVLAFFVQQQLAYRAGHSDNPHTLASIDLSAAHGAHCTSGHGLPADHVHHLRSHVLRRPGRAPLVLRHDLL